MSAVWPVTHLGPVCVHPWCCPGVSHLWRHSDPSLGTLRCHWETETEEQWNWQDRIWDTVPCMVMFVLWYFNWQAVIAINPAVLKETIFHLVVLTLDVDLELSMLTVGEHKHGNTLSLFSINFNTLQEHHEATFTLTLTCKAYTLLYSSYFVWPNRFLVRWPQNLLKSSEPPPPASLI